jgi:hypothetical protein
VYLYLYLNRLFLNYFFCCECVCTYFENVDLFFFINCFLFQAGDIANWLGADTVLEVRCKVLKKKITKCFLYFVYLYII